MSDNPNSDVLDFSREQFARVHTKLDRIGADVSNLKGRVSIPEADAGHTRIGLAEVNSRLDRMDNRLERIEVRLDLVDQPTT
jgi:tetrahydromethanopterin S-methyltransferase subunit G